MLVVVRWWWVSRWANEEAMACGEAKAICYHNGDRGLEGPRLMVARAEGSTRKKRASVDSN